MLLSLSSEQVRGESRRISHHFPWLQKDWPKPAVGNQGFLAFFRALFLFLSLNFLTVLAHMPLLAGIHFLPRLLLYPINKGLNPWLWLCCGLLFFVSTSWRPLKNGCLRNYLQGRCSWQGEIFQVSPSGCKSSPALGRPEVVGTNKGCQCGLERRGHPGIEA